MIIKVIIKKLKVFNEKFTRYYTVESLVLDTDGPIRTERQFTYYILCKHGVGRFLVLGFMMRHKGFFKFWNGDILENGFMRERDKNKELNRLQKELVKVDSFEEREFVEEEIDLEKEIHKEEKKSKRVGPYGLERVKPGILQSYEEFTL